MNSLLDNINMRILRALQKNGRLPNNELAQEVGLSNSACLRRVNILEESGVIDRYAAILNPLKIGCQMIVYVLGTFDDEDLRKRERFVFEMKLLPNIIECHLMAGDYDFILKVQVADLEQFNTFKNRRFLTLLPFF